MPRGRPRKNKEVPLSEESKKLVETGLQEAKEGKIEKINIEKELKDSIKMRELKFRAWDEQNKIMHYNFEFIRSGIEENDWIIFKSDKQKLEDKHVFDNPYFIQQLKIMQFTGLYDKNNREIYEGDFLTGRPNPLLVEYNNSQYDFIYRNPEKKSWLRYMCVGWGDIYEPKIIGNIYENPKLLKKYKND